MSLRSYCLFVLASSLSNVLLTNPELPRLEEVDPQCMECGLSLKQVKEKWGCADTGCSMYGLEQKVRGV